MKKITHLALLLFSVCAIAQTGNLKGIVTSADGAVDKVSISVVGKTISAKTDNNGNYELRNLPVGNQRISVSYIGYRTITETVTIEENQTSERNFELQEDLLNIEEVVITGTMKAVSRSDSPVPVEIYKPSFFKKNPTPNIFEAMQNVNGVRPQINCSVCNTGDIHINGLEGPYTLVLIDGMPIVSGLSTVYGLSGIPNSLIEQVEIVKGPASSLYGSEAVGGLINVITKLPEYAPIFYADINSTSWGEVNTDLSFAAKVGKNAFTLTGINYYNYSNPIDNNNDNFTDVTLQDRVSVFHKWDFKRKDNRKFSVAGRFFYEDRWGGEMQWNSGYRGGDEVYGESIYTKRYEVIGNYQLPVSEKMFFQFSYTDHDQNSVYGDTYYLAQQRIGFGQFLWDKKLGNHDLLFGAAARYTYYNDNTPATVESDKVTIPSVFAQDEISFSDKHTLLLGARYDYDKRHGNIFTPRLAYKWTVTEYDILRFNAGTGFRVVNLFTEDHAAVTGAREVVIDGDLDPEKSYNVNLNYLKKIYAKNGMMFTLDTSVWHTYFTNAIIPDYDTNPNQIIYSNLDGSASSTGASIGIDAVLGSGWKAMLGATYQDVTTKEDGIKTRQMLTEKFMGTWSVSYHLQKYNLLFDYTGNIYGPMRLPLLSELDPRPEYSPTWSIQNIQVTYDGLKNFEIYGGVKNLLNWTPSKSTPFLISRANDPFDNNVTFDGNGQAVATPDNPYALTFDPSYVYASNQGIRMFLGIRYTFK